MRTVRVDVPEELDLPDEDIASALDIVTNAPVVLEQLLREPGGLREPRAKVARTRELRVERWESGRGAPVVAPGEKLLLRGTPYMPLWPREVKVFSRPATVRVCSVQLCHDDYAARGDVVDLRGLGVPMIEVGQSLYVVVENTGTDPSIVRPVVMGDQVDFPGSYVPEGSGLWVRPDMLNDDELDVAAALGHVRRSLVIGMEHGHHRATVTIAGETDGFVVWRALWRCRPMAYRIRSVPLGDGLIVASIRYGNRLVLEKDEAITGGWQPLPLETIDAGFPLAINLRNKSQEDRHVVVELRVEAEAS